MAEEFTDLTSQHIQDFMPIWGEVIPLVSHIKGNLYVGGCKDGARLMPGIKNIVSLYQWGKYDIEGLDVHRLEYEMYDDGNAVDSERVQAIASTAAVLVSEAPTLIHCQAGINRSNLIAAQVLMKLHDMTAREAIALLREKRSHFVLANKRFERWLLIGR